MRPQWLLVLLLLIPLRLTGCSKLIGLDEYNPPSDYGSRDAGSEDSATPDGALPTDCKTLSDGTECAGTPGHWICLTEICARSVCGDGFTDPKTGEWCDDRKNGDDEDGCTDRCERSCASDADCSDNDACTGIETCNASHICQEGQPAICDDQNPCTNDTCVPGSGECRWQSVDDGTDCGGGKICIARACVESTCGDRWVDEATEDCDDGKDGDDDDGCTDQCRYTCVDADDCDDDDACTTDSCNLATHTCVFAGLSCDDGDACTEDTCASNSGCSHALIDNDQDGYSPNVCKPDGAYASQGGDCADTGVNAEKVHPKNLDWFDVPHGLPGLLPFDYDCSGTVATLQNEQIWAGDCSGFPLDRRKKSGWESEIPACGEAALFHDCLLPTSDPVVKLCH